jgi:DNA-binding MarR family transcriptional regulator
MRDNNTDAVPLVPLLGELKELAIEELHRRLNEEGHPEIRPGHGCVFRFIDPEGTRLTVLADRSGFTKQAVGEVVDQLESLDYLERVPDPADGRAKIIRLTGRGLDGMTAARRIFADLEREWAARFGEERIAQLRETLELILEHERGALPA